MAFQDQLKDFWAKSSPKKRNMVLASGVVAAMALGAVVIDAGGSNGGPQRKVAAEPSRTQLMLPKTPDRSVEALAADGQATRDQVAKLMADLSRERQDKELLMKRLDEDKRNSEPDGVTTDLLNEVVELKRRLESVEAGRPAAGAAGAMPSLNDPLPMPVLAGASSPEPEVAAPAAPKLRVSGDAKPVAKKEKVEAAKPIAYLPVGSFLEATLLNGMDAPTSAVAQKNPVPAVLRVKSEALLPNMFSHDIRECFILVSGFGVLASERAQLRTETLSCIKEDGKVIEAKMEGYVIGEDGRVGPRGRLVSKQGQMIARSLAAGVLSGFGEALTPSQIPQLNLSPSGTAPTQRLGIGTVAETGLARGFSDASKAASGFFLEMAREMTPVVEIDAGRKVTVAIIKGLELR